MVVLARLVRPQGRHGEILADILTDFPELFSQRKRLFLQKAGPDVPQRELELECHWLHKGRVVFKFAGIDSIGGAELLRGLEVAIPAEERAPLEDDAVYIADLIGCRIFDRHTTGPTKDPVEVGAIADVDRESTAHPLLIVRGGKFGEVLVPFVKAFLVRVDIAEKRIEMDLPEGLLELNAPMTGEESRRRQAERQREPTGTE